MYVCMYVFMYVCMYLCMYESLGVGVYVSLLVGGVCLYERASSQGNGVAGSSLAAEQRPLHDGRRKRRLQRLQVPLPEEQDHQRQGQCTYGGCGNRGVAGEWLENSNSSAACYPSSSLIQNLCNMNIYIWYSFIMF